MLHVVVIIIITNQRVELKLLGLAHPPPLPLRQAHRMSISISVAIAISIAVHVRVLVDLAVADLPELHGVLVAVVFGEVGPEAGVRVPLLLLLLLRGVCAGGEGVNCVDVEEDVDDCKGVVLVDVRRDFVSPGL